MKTKRLSLSFYIIGISALLVVSITTLLMSFGRAGMDETLYDILYEIDKALILTTIFGTVTKIISDDIVSVKKNDEKMKKLGIHSIGEGRLDKKQTKIMFGGSGYKYPRELKFCFITGIAFLNDLKGKIIEAIKHGTHIKLLLADPIKSKDYLTRVSYINPQGGKYGDFFNQLKEAEVLVAGINELIKKHNYSGSIEIRHYIDEYRYNFRIAKYFDDVKGVTTNAWINFQPINKNAIDQSLTVIGRHDYTNKENESSVIKDSQNIVISLDESFNTLWELYK